MILFWAKLLMLPAAILASIIASTQTNAANLLLIAFDIMTASCFVPLMAGGAARLPG